MTSIFCARSRVAPLKSVSVPRLELCGALLLARLYHDVIKATNIQPTQALFWTDSMVTLHWIRSSPHLLKTFVANRVSEIQDKTALQNWRHVGSQDNPADALSRGQSPKEFIHNSIWRTGPHWLIENETLWPQITVTTPEELLEARTKICLALFSASTTELLRKYSSIGKLRRIIAYCMRFRRDNRRKGPLSCEELEAANNTIMRLVQREAFSREEHDLAHGKGVHRKSPLATLDPFIDSHGVIRVGGRLKHAAIPYNQRHPVVLPRAHHITDLIIQQEHQRNLHSGVQNTLYAIRQRYWPLDGRNQVRKVIRRCIQCFRVNPPNTEYPMGNLPEMRVREARPFSHVGVDYCGPFFIKEKKFRNRNRLKVYVAVFVCLSIKAVHLELVSDLTTEGFLPALRRFISRRGRCNSIYSDNGTNFVGAKNELQEITSLLNSDEHNGKVDKFLSSEGITWHFIPPRSPNFGGLWEAAVKSFKHHFRRVIGDELFTFEELNTFIIETESILNSRPITPISSDPNDFAALTPGHFLIGNALNQLPEVDFSSTSNNRLSNWQHNQKVKRDFWTRWYKEYLNELNVRHKWTHGHHTIREGILVLLKEDHLPPMQWKMGRIIETHPGSDGIIRTVTIKTNTGSLTRNVRKLAPLPNEDQKINAPVPSHSR